MFEHQLCIRFLMQVRSTAIEVTVMEGRRRKKSQKKCPHALPLEKDERESEIEWGFLEKTMLERGPELAEFLERGTEHEARISSSGCRTPSLSLLPELELMGRRLQEGPGATQKSSALTSTLHSCRAGWQGSAKVLCTR